MLDPDAHTANAVKPAEAVLGAFERAAAAAGDADAGGRPRPQRRRAEGSHPYGDVRGRVKPQEVCVRARARARAFFTLYRWFYSMCIRKKVYVCLPFNNQCAA